MVSGQYRQALTRACAKALRGELDVVVFADQHVGIDVDRHGFVRVRLLSEEAKRLLDDWHIVCSDLSATGSPSGGRPYCILVFKPKKR